jgi:hypothetical protein
MGSGGIGAEAAGVVVEGGEADSSLAELIEFKEIGVSGGFVAEDGAIELVAFGAAEFCDERSRLLRLGG